MITTHPPDDELNQLAERYSQVLAWEAAVPNSANTATQLDELEHQVIRSGYSLEDLYELLDENESNARIPHSRTSPQKNIL